MRSSKPLRALLAAALTAGVLAAVSLNAPPAVAAVGGPVILGGDDMTDHGSFNTSTGKPEQGWLYIQNALANISPAVTRANDGTIAALGAQDSTETSCCDAGAAMHYAAAALGKTVTYYNGGTAIDQFFADLAAGTAKPRIIWIAGNQAGNDLSDDPTESDALVAHATAIGDFVNQGGGLMSHGTDYGWLQALLPGATTVDGGSSGDLYLTPAGSAAFPGVTVSDVNAGPWHNYFEGNLGNLQTLVASGDLDDSHGADAPVIIGGSQVTLPGSITLTPATATNPVGTSHTVTATVVDPNLQPRSNVVVTFSVTAGPNAGRTGTGTTNAAGQTTFTYVGTGGVGTDTIQASFLDGSVTRSTTATKTWQASGSTASINDVTVAEGSSGTTPATFTVSLNAPVTAAASVAFATSNGTASAPSDYASKTGTVNFAAGSSSATVTVNVVGDLVEEPDETFTVTLSNPVGLTIGDGLGVGTIDNDDRHGTFLCRALAARTGTVEQILSNGPGTPCADAAKSAVSLSVGTLGTIKALSSATDQTPNVLNAQLPANGDNGKAHAQTAGVSLAIGLPILATSVTADAQVTCVLGVPVTTGSSKVVGLTIGGKPALVGTAYAKISLPASLLTIEVNKRVVVGSKLTQQALVVTSVLFGTVVVGEATVGYSGNPCVVI